ncbi:MAG: type I methionyl aminopeptidase [Halobacteriovoraceae bacterium]|nr:type I methionyl aminopeptidase [Halobacteriovoraceae bacterium]|tara:strand:+ start:104653 stop:105414 length:762 start_codon:yes stop_codon:yes gene_type:complete
MSIENENQFKKMLEIGSIVANCLEYLKAEAKEGITTLELDHLAEKFLAKYGAVSAPRSVYNFPGFVCFSHEREVAHGLPSAKVLRKGDLLNIDVSASKDGYFADNGESFVVGNVKNKKRVLCQHVKTALELALNVARTGTKINRVGLAVEQYAKKHNLTLIRDLGGHGVGQALHEEPEFIGSFCDPRDNRTFTENTVVAIEPFLSNGAHYINESDDGWTLFHDRFYSVQKEHTVMVRSDKPFIFTRPTMSFVS